MPLVVLALLVSTPAYADDPPIFVQDAEINEDQITAEVATRGAANETHGSTQAPQAGGTAGPSGSSGDAAAADDTVELPAGAHPSTPQRQLFDTNLFIECPSSGANTLTVPCATDGNAYLPAAPTTPADPDDEDPPEDAPEPDDEPQTISAADLTAAIRDHTRARITPSPLIVQPDQELQLVNLPVIFRTEPGTQTFTTELIGLPVEIQAHPASYTWDYGDNTPVLNTTDPGAPYPNHTIEHTYTAPGQYQATLFTYWSGRFRIADSDWIPIDGLGITATTSPNLDVQERTTRLTQ